jgi:hypothetical protein
MRKQDEDKDFRVIIKIFVSMVLIFDSSFSIIIYLRMLRS